MARSVPQSRFSSRVGSGSAFTLDVARPSQIVTHMLVPTLYKLLGVELIKVSTAEKIIATLGGGLSILVLVVFSHWVIPDSGATAVITSMGATAVLLFAVPHG